MTPTEPNRVPKRKKIRLPFDNRKQDAGAWAYDHRVALSITLIAYLLFGIAFVAAKIVVGGTPHLQGIYIDMENLEELQKERDRLEEQVQKRLQQQEKMDWSTVRNEASNENAENDNVRSMKGNVPSDLSAEASEVDANMRANRAAYERGLAEERAIRDSKNKDSKQEYSDRRVKGNVTVSFSFKDPVRHKVSLPIPAYQCENGGMVVVEVTLDRGGRVSGAKVISGSDDFMCDVALRAARNSKFNIDNSAPAKHVGTITYTFIPQ